MLFDLRSRGRRRTVRGVYLGLALLMGLGLVLFGVGAGNGIGGLLNAFTGNGSSGNQNQAVTQQVQSALKAVHAHPSSAAAWSNLVQARWSAAGQNGTCSSGSVCTFTAAGKKQLTGATQAWQHYVQLTKRPDPTLAQLVARSYGYLGNYAGAASAWEVETASSPNEVLGYECLAASAYAAGQTDRADLALNKALSLSPKAQRATVKSEVTAAKTNPSIVQQAC